MTNRLRMDDSATAKWAPARNVRALAYGWPRELFTAEWKTMLDQTRVLYLDDDVQLSFLLARALTARGHSITAANDATTALQAYAKEPQGFDFVITDMSMFGMSGLEFAQEVLKLNPAAKVIILSGCEDPNWAGYARSCGVREVMEKSAAIEAMAAALDSRLRA